MSSNVGPGLATRIPPPSINPHIVPAYSLIVAGATQAGKSSLLRLLLDTAPISPHATQAHLESLARFVRAVQHPEPTSDHCEVEVLWAGERVLLRLFDTPGLDFSVGAEDDLDRVLRDIVTLVEERYVEGARDESTVGESHVHLCLYILDPATIVPRSPYPAGYRRTSSASSSSSSDPYSPYSPAAPLASYPPSLPPAEITAIRRLSSRVNVLPVLGRCDAVGVDRLAEIKRAVRRDLADAGLGFGIFDEDGETGVAPTALPVASPSTSDPAQDTETVPLLPYALFAPECYAAPARKLGKRELVGMYAAAIEQPPRAASPREDREAVEKPERDSDVERMDALKGRFVRRYRWGVLDALDARHSDFGALRRAAMVHRKVLKTYTKDYLYEKFKVDSLMAQHARPRLTLPHTHHAHLSPPQSHAHHLSPHAHAPMRAHVNSLASVLPPVPYQRALPPIVPSQAQGQGQVQGQGHPQSVQALLNHGQGHAQGFKREREEERERERDDEAGVAAGPGVEGVPVGLTANGRKRKITMACNFCRSRKLKCDGLRPACAQCVKRGNTCDYQPHAHAHGNGASSTGPNATAAAAGAGAQTTWKYKRRDTTASAPVSAIEPADSAHDRELDARRHALNATGAGLQPGPVPTSAPLPLPAPRPHPHPHPHPHAREEDVDELDDDVASSDDARTVYEGRKRVSVDMLIAETLGDGSSGSLGGGAPAGKPPTHAAATAAAAATPPAHAHASPPHHTLHAGYDGHAHGTPGYASEAGTWYAETEGAGAGPGMGVIDVGSEGDKKKRLNRQSANYGSKAVACVHCRARKTRCDAARPACGNCARRSLACSYIHTQPSQPRSKGKKAAAAAAKEEAARHAARTNGSGSADGSLSQGSGSPRMGHGSTSPRMLHDRHSHESSVRTSPLHWQHHSPSRSPRVPHSPSSPIRVDDRIIEESAERDRPLSRSPAAPPIATLGSAPPAPARSPHTASARSPASTTATSPVPPSTALPKHDAVLTNGHDAKHGAVLSNGHDAKHEAVFLNGNGNGHAAKLEAILTSTARTPERGQAPADDGRSRSPSSSVGDVKAMLGGKRKTPLDVGSDEECDRPEKRYRRALTPTVRA